MVFVAPSASQLTIASQITPDDFELSATDDSERIVCGATTNPESYRRAADAIGFDTHRILYVAAHTSDLEVVRTLGMRTAYVRSRLDEYGESPPTGDAAERYDLLADDDADLADRLL